MGGRRCSARLAPAPLVPCQGRLLLCSGDGDAEIVIVVVIGRHRLGGGPEQSLLDLGVVERRSGNRGHACGSFPLWQQLQSSRAVSPYGFQQVEAVGAAGTKPRTDSLANRVAVRQ